MNEQDQILKLTRKNYTIWSLMIMNELQKRKFFEALSSDQINRPNMNFERKSLIRNMRSDCMKFLFSVVDNEIYEEIKEFVHPYKLLSYLQLRYSKQSIKRLGCKIKELQNIQFNLENFEIFIKKFQKIVGKVKDCGLKLDDCHLNLYLLSSLDRSKRIDNAKEFYKSLDCKFDEFINRIKDKIISSSDIQYSDISNESISFNDDEYLKDMLKPKLKEKNNSENYTIFDIKQDKNSLALEENVVDSYDNKYFQDTKKNYYLSEADACENTSKKISRDFDSIKNDLKSINVEKVQIADNQKFTSNFYEDLSSIEINSFSPKTNNSSESFICNKDSKPIPAIYNNMSTNSKSQKTNDDLHLNEEKLEYKIDLNSSQFFYIDKHLSSN